MLARRVRGAATVEAVILLPTLLILLFGARFIVRRFEAETTALRDARVCAFQFAYGGCKEVPPGCKASIEGPLPGADPDGVGGISRELATAESAVRRLSSVPVLGSAVDGLLGQYSTSETRRSFEGPTPNPDGAAPTNPAVRENAIFPCNEVPRTDDVARQVFESVTAPFF